LLTMIRKCELQKSLMGRKVIQYKFYKAVLIAPILISIILSKKPTDSWHNAVKNISNHQKPCERPKIALRFSSQIFFSCGLNKIFALFQAQYLEPICSSWARENRQLNINYTDVGQHTVAGFALLTLLCSGN